MLTGLLIVFPFLLSLILSGVKDNWWIKIIAFGGSVVEFILSLYALFVYQTQCHCQLLLEIDWLNRLGITFQLGMDGLSMMLVLLTTFLTPLIILSSFGHNYKRSSSFYGLILFMEMALIVVFTSLNGMLFYIFWELALVPAYFITVLRDGNERIRITFKFFIYTFIGSLAMVGGLIYLYYKTPSPHSFDIRFLYGAILSPVEQRWIFWAFFLAFAVMIPVFLFHAWQPDTYVSSPPGTTMVLAGIMVEMGTYGLIRFLLPVCPLAMKDWGFVAMMLVVTGIVYASLIALRQNDMKRLAVYFSIVQTGLIATGILSITIKGLEGAVIQMVSTGINLTGFFIIIDMIESRMQSRKINELAGIAGVAPWFAVILLIILLGNVALPFTNGFIGEYLILSGLFEYNWLIAAIAGLTIIFTVFYMLRMYQRTMLGNQNELTKSFTDITLRESLVLAPLVVMIFWIGLFPGFFFHLTEPAIKDILQFSR
jgi:NADH-quinone oxidoreductase subunit M